jgi:hypothetical protein
VGPRAGLGPVTKRKNFHHCSCRELNPARPAHGLIAIVTCGTPDLSGCHEWHSSGPPGRPLRQPFRKAARTDLIGYLPGWVQRWFCCWLLGRQWNDLCRPGATWPGCQHAPQLVVLQRWPRNFNTALGTQCHTSASRLIPRRGRFFYLHHRVQTASCPVGTGGSFLEDKAVGS